MTITFGKLDTVNINKLEPTELGSSTTMLHLIISRVPLGDKKLSPVLQNRRSVLEQNRKLGKRTSHNKIGRSAVLLAIRLQAAVDGSEPIEAELLNDCVHSVDLLPHRVKKVTRLTGNHAQRHTRKTSTGTHIHKRIHVSSDIGNKRQRVDNMQHDGIIEIGDARQVDIGIHLVDVQQMLQAKSRLIIFERDTDLLGKRAKPNLQTIEAGSIDIQIVKQDCAIGCIGHGSDLTLQTLCSDRNQCNKKF